MTSTETKIRNNLVEITLAISRDLKAIETGDISIMDKVQEKLDNSLLRYNQDLSIIYNQIKERCDRVEGKPLNVVKIFFRDKEKGKIYEG